MKNNEINVGKVISLFELIVRRYFKKQFLDILNIKLKKVISGKATDLNTSEEYV